MCEKIIIFFKNMDNVHKFLFVVVILIVIYLIVMLINNKNSTSENMSTTPSNLNTSTLTVDLYYSPSCGHCVRFKPEWEKLKQIKGITFNEHNCSLGECPADITGVPTLKINGKTYTDEMNAFAIADYLKRMS